MDSLGNIMQMTESLRNMMRAGSNLLVALGLAITAIVALAQCFFGFKLMRLWFAVCGFLLGAVSAVAVCGWVLNVAQPGPYIAAALICGVLGALLLYRVYLVGVFLMDASLAMLLFLLLLGIENWALAVSGLCAIIVGVCAVKFVRPWVIACTGLSGGITAGSSILMLLGVGNGGL